MADEKLQKHEATVRDFLGVVFRRKYMILALVVLTTVVIGLLTAAQPTVYVSSSRVLVKRGELASVFSGQVRYLGWREEMASEIEVLLSEPVFRRARQIFADSLKARRIVRPLAFKPGMVRGRVMGESNVLGISASSHDPEEARLTCIAMTEAYKRQYREQQAPPELSDFFAQEIKDVVTELEHWREERNDFLNRSNFTGMGDEARYHMGKLSGLETDLTKVESEISQQRLRVDRLKGLAGMSMEELEDKLAFSSSPQVMQSAILSNIKYTLQNLRIHREELLNKYTEKHPEVVAIDNQIRDLQTDLKQEVVNTYNVENSELEEMSVNKNALEKEIAETRKALSAIPDKELALNRYDNKIEVLEKRYELLMSKQHEAEIARASTPERAITVLSAASRATPRKTRDYVRLALGPFLALIVGLGLAFFFESLDHSLKNTAEVEEYLGKPVLAVFSEFGGKN